MNAQQDNLTEQLVDYTLGLSYESLPPGVVDRTKQLFLDYLGVALGGRVYADPSESILRAVTLLSDGQRGQSTVVGDSREFPPHFAALLNGAFAHGMDFDDTHRDGIMHPGAPIFSTLMALAEEKGSDGKEFLTAAVAAYDVANKIGRAVGEGVHKRGLHPTATSGIFAATASGARMVGLSREQALNALGINVSQAAGSQQFLEQGRWNKPLHVGLAAHNAIYALKLAACGFKGAVQPLEGRFGYFYSYSADGWDPTKITGLGTDFEVMSTAIKPYPCCRYNHGLIDAALELVWEHQMASENIATMDVYISPVGHSLVGEPVGLKRNPTSVIEGQFSAYFAAAVTAVDGEYTWASYTKLQDPAVKDLMAVTTVHPTPEMERMACQLRITTKDGRTLQKDVTLAKGEPETPLTWEEATAKFISLAQHSLGLKNSQRVLEAVQVLEGVQDVSEFTALLRP